MNQVILIGRITRNLTLKTSTNGKSFVYFTVATNEIKDKTDYISCVAWNKTAENMARYVGKGSLISVNGRINVRKDNQDQYITEVVANNVTFLENKRREQDNDSYYEQPLKHDNSDAKNEVDINKAFADEEEYNSDINFVNNKDYQEQDKYSNDNDEDDEAIIWE